MAEFLQNVDVVDHVQKNEEKMIADEADPGHQSDEDIALFQDPLPQEDTEDHSLQGEGGLDHHHLGAPKDHVQGLQRKGRQIKMIHQQRVTKEQKPQ